MFFDDHGYPHFHARHAAGEAKVRIDNLEVIDSALPRRQLRLVLEWAELHPMIGLTPDITAAAVVRHGVLRLSFADGTTGELEVLERMHGPVFDEARTPEGFAKVTVDEETGTVVWPGGADLAPDTLYERVRTGAWPDSRVTA